MGLWVSGMEDTQVYLTPPHSWFGWTCLRDRDIFVVRISMSRWFNASAWSLADILRHMYGHVVALLMPRQRKHWTRNADRVSMYARTNKALDLD